MWRQAGATAVVPETLEPSLQLASAVLSQLNMPPDDVQEAIQEFRRTHIGELQASPLMQHYSITSVLGTWFQGVKLRVVHTSKMQMCTLSIAVFRISEEMRLGLKGAPFRIAMAPLCASIASLIVGR